MPTITGRGLFEEAVEKVDFEGAVFLENVENPWDLGPV